MYCSSDIAVRIKKLAKEKKILLKDMKDLINTVYLDFDEWVRVQIESYIKNK